MPHAVTRIPAPHVHHDGAWRVHTVPAASDNLVWVIASADGEAAVVDGPNAQGALALCEAEGLRLTTILTTHTHGDHIGLHHHLEMEGLLDGIRVVGAADVADQIPGLTEPVGEGDAVTFAGVSMTVMRTDGHMTGHVCYVSDEVAFVGDTLFTAGCGKVFDGPMSAMADSLMRLGALPSSIGVYCAHEYTLDNLAFAWFVEPDNAALAERIRRVRALRAEGGCAVPATLGEEQATNPYLRPGSPTIRARLAELVPGAPLESTTDVIGALRGLKDTGRHRQDVDLEAV